MRLCHLGDLGHTLSDKERSEIGPVDILFVPIGGYYTIDAPTAWRVCESLKPHVIIPMHYKSPKLDFPITGVDLFIEGKKNVVRKETSEVEFTAGTLPSEVEVLVLESAN